MPVHETLLGAGAIAGSLFGKKQKGPSPSQIIRVEKSAADSTRAILLTQEGIETRLLREAREQAGILAEKQSNLGSQLFRELASEKAGLIEKQKSATLEILAKQGNAERAAIASISSRRSGAAATLGGAGQGALLAAAAVVAVIILAKVLG